MHHFSSLQELVWVADGATNSIPEWLWSSVQHVQSTGLGDWGGALLIYNKKFIMLLKFQLKLSTRGHSLTSTYDWSQ